MAIDSPQGPDRVPASNRSLRSYVTTALAFLAGALLTFTVLVLIVRASQGWAGSVSSWLQRTTHTDLSQPTVVDRIQKLQRLETVVYTMEKIVTGEKESSVLPTFPSGRRLLL